MTVRPNHSSRICKDAQADCERAARRPFSRFSLHAVFRPHTCSRVPERCLFYAQNGVRFWLGAKADPVWTWRARRLRKASKYTGGTAKVKQESRGEGPVGGFFVSLGEWSSVSKVEEGIRDGCQRCDRWGVCELRDGWIWGEGEGGATDSNRECRWRSRTEVEKANSNLSYLGHLWRDQGPKQASQPHRCSAD